MIGAYNIALMKLRMSDAPALSTAVASLFRGVAVS